MKKLVLAILLLTALLFGCLQSGGAASATPTASASPTPSGTVQAEPTVDAALLSDDLVNASADLDALGSQ